MLVVQAFLFIFILRYSIVLTKTYCDKTTLLLSKCDNTGKYQWLIEVPKTETSCDDSEISPPQSVLCNFGCTKGSTFDRDTLDCRKCSAGTFSLGGGIQYTFDSDENLQKKYPELILKGLPLLGYSSSDCKTKDIWKIKGNTLQGDVQPSCAISLALNFKIMQTGSVIINYNLATSYVFGYISSRCDFTLNDDDKTDDDDDEDDENDSTREKEFHLRPTGYGIWKEKRIEIQNSGEYKLTLFTLGMNAFHFPFAIRSIAIEGMTHLQDCISCPKGTYASTHGSETCTACPRDTYASQEGSSKCMKCPSDQYAEEGSAECLPRPTCEEKHYRKIFLGCEKSTKAQIIYEPIQPIICINGGPPETTEAISCATCNPGMYKNKTSNQCEFCPESKYSNGTSSECLSCANKLSLLPGLYYHNWNELPKYLERSYLVFDNSNYLKSLNHNQSWIPSITYISSQSVPNALSVLSLTITHGFRSTDIAKSTKEYGTLYFKFSVQCQSSCSLFLVSQDVFPETKNTSNEEKNWEILHKWKISGSTDHKNITDYTYSIQYPDQIIFNWLFASDDSKAENDEIRIYEIRVSNTQMGGSDRCTTCLTVNNQETECKACSPGNILWNNTCIPCPPSTIASRIRSHDPVPLICKPCPTNTISDDGISCYVPCKQSFSGTIEYDLNRIATIDFHGSKLFTQKGSGYFHVFNASICGKTSATCKKTPTESDTKHSSSQLTIESKLCRMGSIPDKDTNSTSIAYIDDFGEQLSNISLITLKYFPPLRSDYNLTDITLVFSANTSGTQSFCLERITYLSLRCDHILEEDKPNSTVKYLLQTPNNCATGTCDGCTFSFLLRTPLACPICDENTDGYRTFSGPCKFGRQEVRKIPLPYCAHQLSEKVEIRRCSILSTEIQIIIALFLVIAGILISLVIFCWRKNRKLEYRYMQLIENTNPDDDAPVDNVCAQLSDEDDSGEEVQFQTQSKTKKIMNVVRKAIGKGSSNGRSDAFSGDSFLLTSSATNDA